jgi:hypothetical protein
VAQIVQEGTVYTRVVIYSEENRFVSRHKARDIPEGRGHGMREVDSGLDVNSGYEVSVTRAL